MLHFYRTAKKMQKKRERRRRRRRRHLASFMLTLLTDDPLHSKRFTCALLRQTLDAFHNFFNIVFARVVKKGQGVALAAELRYNALHRKEQNNNYVDA